MINIYINESILLERYGKYHKRISTFVNQFFARLSAFDHKNSYPANQKGFVVYENNEIDIYINDPKEKAASFIKTNVIPYPFIIKLIPVEPTHALGEYTKINGVPYIKLYVNDDAVDFIYGNFIDHLKSEYASTLAHELTHLFNDFELPPNEEDKQREVSFFNTNETDPDKNYYFSYQEIFARVQEALLAIENKILKSVQFLKEQGWPLAKIIKSHSKFLLKEQYVIDSVKNFMKNDMSHIYDKNIDQHIESAIKEEFPQFKSRLLKQIKKIYKKQ